MTKRTEQRHIEQARVLGGFTLDGVDYNPNDIIETDPELIKSLGTSVDTEKEAIDYCLALDKPVIKRHEYTAKPAQAEPETPETKPVE